MLIVEKERNEKTLVMFIDVNGFVDNVGAICFYNEAILNLFDISTHQEEEKVLYA